MARSELSSFLSTLSFGPAQTCRNLTVIPILAPEGAPSGLVTLDESLARGVAEVTEVSEGGDIPQLLFLNHGNEPILLIEGEELVGARQNRVLNVSIVAPARQSLEIPVSCVEQGRWAWKSRRFTTSDRIIYAKLRRANVETVSSSLRRYGRHDSDQCEVWNSISRKSARLRVSSETSDAGAIYEHHTADIDDFVASFKSSDRQVGAAFQVNGRLAGLEVFGSPDLLSRLMPKVIRGYAVDALEDEGPERPREPALDPIGALSALRRSRKVRHPAIGLGEDLRFKGQGLVGAGLIADGKVVHLTAYAADYA